MFQNFDPVSDKSFAAKHLPLLRAQLQLQGLDGLLVPHDDEYLNEYLPAAAERLMWASGFSGSAGASIILQDKAHIFTDGRYTIQVRDQVDADYFEFHDYDAASLANWLATNVQKGMTIGYDPMLHSKAALTGLQEVAQKVGCSLKAVSPNPIDVAWKDRPAPSSAQIVPHAEQFAGRSSQEKRQLIASELVKENADAVVLTAPHSLAWLFNIRGGDVHATPIALGRAIFFKDGTAKLFVSRAKVTEELRDHLGSDVEIFSEALVADHLQELGKKQQNVMLDPAISPVWFYTTLVEAGAHIIERPDPCALPRARKNDTEIEGARNAHIRDGEAITNFLHWLATQAQDGSQTEISAAQKLEDFRSKSNLLKDISFDTISGAGSHGAICHYRVTSETNKTIEPGTLYLVDSGGQYPDGTTDITRTLAIGEPSEEMRNRYTLVLKGHIALATAKFPKGTTGHQLDILARRPLYEAGLDYDHGTGHGVGSYLGVHEGPQNISKKAIHQPLEPGMICSNEPGYYKEGEFGIRIENLIIVNKPEPITGGEREMLSFETITMAPLARELIDTDMLTEQELAWVNDYHRKVREKLQPQLSGEALEYLLSQTEEL
ncbi:MAG: M24 family metallopeptidase [bacterium]